MESDWFWTTIVKGYIAPWKSGSDDQNRTVLRAYASSAAVLASGGYGLVLEGIIGPWFLPDVLGEIRARGVDAHYAVLRPSLEVALDRASARANDDRVFGNRHLADRHLTDPEPVRFMWERFSDLGEYERFVIDNTHLTVEETVQIVLERLHSGALRLGI